MRFMEKKLNFVANTIYRNRGHNYAPKKRNNQIKRRNHKYG